MDHPGAAELLDAELQKHLSELKAMSKEQMMKTRYDKFRHMAQFFATV